MGKKAALISIGMSCQTGRQIDNAVDIAREITGDATLAKKSLPFDWLICPPLSAAGMLLDNEFFPTSPDELKPYPLEEARDRSPCIAGWPRRNTYFWHEFTATEATIESGFRQIAHKFRYLADSFRALRGKRVYAFLSNTQFNFDMIERVTGVSSTLRASEINTLKDALDHVMGHAVPMCVVNDCIVRDARERYRSFSVQQSVEHWAGDATVWQPVIRKFLTNPGGLTESR